MPVNLSIKHVPDAIAVRLRARAAGNHRSLQRELMAIVEVAAATPAAFGADDESAGVASRGQPHTGKRLRPIEEVAHELDKLFPRPLARGPSSVEIIRAMRDGHCGDLSDASPRRRRPG
jgi:plasmid stability protein